jgi:integrase
MASFTKRTSRRGTRYTVRVRSGGSHITKTFGTRAAGEAWARAQEHAIDTGEFYVARVGGAAILADLIDIFLAHRKRIGRPPGNTFQNALDRLKLRHGLEASGNLTVAFWRQVTLDRIAEGIDGSTVASDLAYATSVLKHAVREGHRVDAQAPGLVRTMLREDGIRVTSRQRTRRLSDAEIKRLLAWLADNAHRSHVPVRDLVEFALATGLRRGEILALEWLDIDGRVITIRRKHPTDRGRLEEVPLLKPHAIWPKVDPLEIIKRQRKHGARIFPYLGDTLIFWFEKACKETGITGVVFHTLRHECLSRLADRGFDPLRLAMVGGHRDLRNVKRYAKLDARLLANE